MRIADARLPDTAATRAAMAVAERFCTTALLEHSIRSWYWARGFGAATGVEPSDPELLAVAALLHDVGLTPAFDAVTLPFETAGGNVGWAVTAGAGWAPGRRERVVEVIERHMWPEVDPADDPEGHLLEIATALDIAGARADVLPRDYVAEVLAAHPRGGIGTEFTACMSDQAARKPGSQASRIIAAGLSAKLADDPEGHLLEVATALDVAGARADVLPRDYVAEVLTAHPRGGIGTEFTACMSDQAARKPGSQASRIVAAGLAAKLADHPFER